MHTSEHFRYTVHVNVYQCIKITFFSLKVQKYTVYVITNSTCNVQTTTILLSVFMYCLVQEWI